MKTFATATLAVAFGLTSIGVAVPAAAVDLKEKAGDIKEEVKDKAQEIKDKAVEIKDKLKEKTTAAKDRMKSALRRDKDRASSTDVSAAQEALRAKGYDPGPIDGVIGPRTSAAVREFQTKEGLDTTGRLDSATVGRLGVGTTASSDSSTPSASPRTDSTTPEASKPRY